MSSCGRHSCWLYLAFFVVFTQHVTAGRSSIRTKSTSSDGLHLTSNNEGSLKVIQGFAAQLQCVLHSCSNDVAWYKDGTQLFQGTKLLNTSAENVYKLQHSIQIAHEKECSGECDDSKPCGEGFACAKNECCSCLQEEFSLVIRNLSFDDSGIYQCQLGSKTEPLEFQVKVEESGLKGGFHKNITYDHSKCCQEKGISPICRGLCKPSEMDQYHFDPTRCKISDFQSFQSCASDGGTRNHVYCCKNKGVPDYCLDFCAGHFENVFSSHRRCIQYFPAIYSCLERALLPYPEPPREIQVNSVNHDKLAVCWKQPKELESNEMYPILDYTVYYRNKFFRYIEYDDIELPFLTGNYMEDLVRLTKGGKNSPSGESTKGLLAFNGHFQITTTDSCVTLSGLFWGSTYTVFVTARNGFGSSIPSFLNIATTDQKMVNVTESMECCSNNGVSEVCAVKMCNVTSEPSILSISAACRTEWSKVDPCISYGRRYTACCLQKGVHEECLGVCGDNVEGTDVLPDSCPNSVLLSVHECIREGYDSRPSPPSNVRITDISSRSVTVAWDKPEANAHLAETYTITYRANGHGKTIGMVQNAVSPHVENYLDFDREYVLAVISHSTAGTSLLSTVHLFKTLPLSHILKCPVGEPIYMNDGGVFRCDRFTLCPRGFHCSGTDGMNRQACCPDVEDHKSDGFQACCKEQQMPTKCMSSCYHSATLGGDCKENLNIWLQCASEGHDHTRCCLREQVSEPCRKACRHPFAVSTDECYNQTSKYRTCFNLASLKIPHPVDNFWVTEVTKNSATLKWEDSQAFVTGYKIQLFDKRGILLKSANTSAHIYRFSDLEPRKQYSVCVYCTNLAGSGPPSWNETFITEPAGIYEPRNPVAPEALRVVWNTGPSVNVTWKRVTLRRNDEPVIKPIEYTLYYLDTEKSTTWEALKTNETWMVMRHLRQDSLLHVYVTAKEEDRTSSNSSIITVLAQQDSLGLPEPHINITPNSRNGKFAFGDKITVNCSLPNVKEMQVDIHLAVGPHVVHNDRGVIWAILKTEVDETTDTAKCTVSDIDGRKHVAMMHLIFEKEGSVTMMKEHIRVMDDDSVEIGCVYHGSNLNPVFRFEHEGKEMTRGFLKLRMTEDGYVGVWNLKRVQKSDAGIYKCIVESDDKNKPDMEAQSELVLPDEIHPFNLKSILDCCMNERIEHDCIGPCMILPYPSSFSREKEQCTRHAASYLKCASDVLDHTDCCISSGVSENCLPLCSGDTSPRDAECSAHVIAILRCSIESYGNPFPGKVENVRISSSAKKGCVKIEWDYPAKKDNEHFEIRYGKKNEAVFDWTTKNTVDTSIDLEVDPLEEYEVKVIVVTDSNRGAIESITIPRDPEGLREKETDSSSPLWTVVTLVFLVLLITIIAIVVRSENTRNFLQNSWQRITSRLNPYSAVHVNQGTVRYVVGPSSSSSPEERSTEIQSSGSSGSNGSNEDTNENQAVAPGSERAELEYRGASTSTATGQGTSAESQNAEDEEEEESSETSKLKV